MPNTKKYFNQGLNADDDFEIVEPGAYINGQNIRFGTTDEGKTGIIESVGGTKIIYEILVEGNNLPNGGCEDQERNRIVWLNCNSLGEHGIYCFDRATGLTYTVLLSSQVKQGLNIDKNHFIHSCRVINGSFYFTDNLNEPCRVNIDRGIKTNHATYDGTAGVFTTPIEFAEITVIRRPPSLPPVATKLVYADTFSSIFNVPPNYLKPPVTNNIEDTGFLFAWRFNYLDNEISVLSPFSNLVDKNFAFDKFNLIGVNLPVLEIGKDVATVDIIVANPETKKCFISYTWDLKRPLNFGGSSLSGLDVNTYYFTNHQLGIYIGDVDSIKQADYVPLLAETLERAKNRLKFANYLQGLTSPATTSLRCNVVAGNGSGFTTIQAQYKNIFFEGSFFPSGVRVTNGLRVLLYVPDIGNAGYYKLGTGNIPLFPGPLVDSFLNFTYVGPGIINVAIAIENEYNISNPGQTFTIDRRYLGEGANATITLSNVVVNNTNNGGVSKFKNSGYYETGIFFTGIGGRRCGVVKSNPLIFPDRNYLDSSLDTGFAQWSLSAPVAGEIPLYATEYHIVRSKCLSTGFFMSSRPGANDLTTLPTSAVKVTYANKNPNTGAFTYGSFFSPNDIYAVAVDISILTNYNMGYVFEEGDELKLYSDTSTEPVKLSIIGQDGKYVHCNPAKLEIIITINSFTGGVGYTDGTYTNIPMTGGTGQGFTANITVAGGIVTAVTINKNGIGYTNLDVLSVARNLFSLMSSPIGTGLGFTITGVVRIVVNTVFEIYTPYKPSTTEPFYEVSQSYKILNPGTVSRTYSTLVGFLPGDVYLLTRKDAVGTYLVEAMSPRDKFWRVWNTAASKPNFIDTIGQKRITGGICFSDTYETGTKVNGLSSFGALNVVNLPAEYGAVQKLQLTKKVQEDGEVMLAICSYECASIYLGETELFDTQGTAYVARASGVLGTIKALSGSMGTMHPESVFEHNGAVYWWSTRNDGAVQYSINGLFLCSKNKLTRFSKLFSEDYQNLSTQDIEDLGGRKLIIGGFDPYHKEVLFSIPATRKLAPKGLLEDYSDLEYPYDVYDGKTKTLVYKHEVDRWGAPMTFTTGLFIKLGNQLYSVKDGSLHLHNQPNHAEFFGVQHLAKIAYVTSLGGNVSVFSKVAIEANMPPVFAHFRTEKIDESDGLEKVQSSDLVDDEFTNKEGNWYSPIMRDRLSPNEEGEYIEIQHKGDKMRGRYLLTMLSFHVKQNPLQLKAVDTDADVSQGHFILQP